jgi:hypothetical protein
MSMDRDPLLDPDGVVEDSEEVMVGLDEDDNVVIQSGELELLLTPAEARDLAHALLETADEAEGAVE